MSVAASPIATAARSAGRFPWFVGPWADVVIGCGAWSLPLIAIVAFLNRADALAVLFAFYALSTVCNYPHYFATIHRAYGTASDFRKYRFFTIYLTALLLLTAVLAHRAEWVLPLLFTIYVTWSPWHYSAQNFGIGMMFARRGGLQPQRLERNLYYTAFAASFAIVFFSTHGGIPTERYLLSLHIPMPIATAARIAFFVLFAVAGTGALWLFARRGGWRAAMLPGLLLGTQFLWFVLPTLVQVILALPVSPEYYSAGVLAFMHCSQYLWVTSYYAKREADAGVRAAWRPFAYFGGLIVGGIALFLPGPWIVSRLFGHDLIHSILIFQALVNIHHFMIDGAIWKLRDGRVAALLLGNGIAGGDPKPTDWIARTVRAAAALWRGGRWVLVPALLGVAAMDLAQYYLTTTRPTPERLALAEKLNPADTRVPLMVARQHLDHANLAAAKEQLRRALSIHADNPDALREYGRLAVDAGQAEEGWRLLQRAAQLTSPDLPSLLNEAMAANAIGDEEQARAKYERLLRLDPAAAPARAGYGDWHFSRKRYREAAEQYSIYLHGIAPLLGKDPRALPEYAGVALRHADCLAKLGDRAAAVRVLEEAYGLTARNPAMARRFAEIAGRLADFAEEAGDRAAAAAYHAEALETLERFPQPTPLSLAYAWYNFATFLERGNAPQDHEHALACLRISEDLLAALPPAEDLRRVRNRALAIAERIGEARARENADSDAAMRRTLLETSRRVATGPALPPP